MGGARPAADRGSRGHGSPGAVGAVARQADTGRSDRGPASHRYRVARCATAVAQKPRHPWTAETSSPEPLRQRITQRDGLILSQREYALAGDMRVQLDAAVALGDHHVGEPDDATVRAARGVDDPPVGVGSARCLGYVDHGDDRGLPTPRGRGGTGVPGVIAMTRGVSPAASAPVAARPRRRC